ncbi:LysR family transcriptional regulator [Sagittula sp. S175]|uniref:LysR family transcriptional regulator n=1 Tax=Sagittula sp. S175 TaxID=3415129 RepID=UPI003C7BA506
MDLVDELKAFVATAQSGSFTAAAAQLGVSNRLTSKYVAELETRLGVRLLQRTTRRVGLTPAGEDLLARVPAVLEDLEEVLGSVTEGSQGLSGMVRVSAPVTFGEVWVGAMLGRFAQAHPGVTVDLRLSDAFTDLASEGIDLAFRIGTSDVLSLKQKRLGAFQSVLVASPGYLAAHGTPQRIEDLVEHACILDTNRRRSRRWSFVRDGVAVDMDVQGRFMVNSARAVVALAEAGLGIALVPRFALGETLETGRLVTVLPGSEAESGPISAIYLEGRALPRKIRALIDFAAEDIRQSGML